MNLDLLQSFCSTGANRFQLSKPFTVGEWTYATNGRICIRVPSEGAAQSADFPKQIETIGWNHDKVTDWQTTVIPQGPLQARKCNGCDGLGNVRPCRNCSGDGSCRCRCCEDEHECKTCGGDGYIPCVEGSVCETCDGSKWLYDHHPIQVRGANLSDVLVRMTVELPALEWAPSIDLTPSLFRFDGGQGILLPLRVR